MSGYKIKTHKGAQKRFKKTAGGKFKRGCSHQRHILTKKTAKRKRHLRKGAIASHADERRLRDLLTA